MPAPYWSIYARVFRDHARAEQKSPIHKVRASRSEHEPSAQTVDWSHRWEVRGHSKHFRKGPVYEANPDDRIEVDGDSYVRVWCPPFVKGPADKPLIPKAHVYAGGRR